MTNEERTDRWIKDDDADIPSHFFTKAELARREQAAGVAGCHSCGFSFRSTTTTSLEKGECANCGADWPLHGKREQAQAPQHTPGPWGVGYGEDRVITIGPYPCVVADCAPNDELSLEEVAANAALIARAPELLAENARLRSLLAELTEAASRHVICMNFNRPYRGLAQEEKAVDALLNESEVEE